MTGRSGAEYRDSYTDRDDNYDEHPTPTWEKETALSFIDKFKSEYPTIEERIEHRRGLPDHPERTAEPIIQNFNSIEFKDNDERNLVASQIAQLIFKPRRDELHSMQKVDRETRYENRALRMTQAYLEFQENKFTSALHQSDGQSQAMDHHTNQIEDSIRNSLVYLDERSNNYHQQVFELLDKDNQFADAAARALIWQECFHHKFYEPGQRKLAEYSNYPMIESPTTLAHMALEEKLTQSLVERIPNMDLETYLEYSRELKRVDFQFHSETVEGEEFAQERQWYIEQGALPPDQTKISASDWKENPGEAVNTVAEQLQHINPEKVVGGEHHLGAIRHLMQIHNAQARASAELNTSREELREKLPNYQVMSPERNEIVSALNTLDNQDHWVQKALHTSATAIQWMVRTEPSEDNEEELEALQALNNLDQEFDDDPDEEDLDQDNEWDEDELEDDEDLDRELDDN